MHVYMFGICIYRGSSDLLDAQFLSAPGAPLWPTGVGGVVAVEREYTVKIK